MVSTREKERGEVVNNISSINTLEIASVCNNACEYCPVPHQSKYRKCGFMDDATFEQSLHWLRHFTRKGTQKELNLYGLGEPTLHPKLAEYVSRARAAIGSEARLQLTTNGNGMNEKLAWDLIDAGITNISVSAHKARPAAIAIRILGNLGILRAVDYSWVLQPHDWAGQIDWLKSVVKYRCHWLDDGVVAITSDGAVSRCCIDAYAQGTYCTVFDDITKVECSPFSLCENCHHIVPARMNKRVVGDIFQHHTNVSRSSGSGVPQPEDGSLSEDAQTGAHILKETR